MNKLYVLPLLLLSGCALIQADGADYPYEEEPVPPLFGDAEDQSSQKPDIHVVEPTPNRHGSAPAVAGTQPIVSADGTYIEIPAQRIYIQAPAGSAAPVGVVRGGVLSYSQPIEQAAPAQPAVQTPVPVYVTLQNQAYPNTFVQCVSSDIACIALHEQQGYVRVQGIPQFAGYREVPAPSDYPAGGRWRHNTNIPRW